jgi:hypothetical protein
MADPHVKHEPVGLFEIGKRLDVKQGTLDRWCQFGLLPEARWTIGGQRAWCWRCDVEPWARRWGRR